MATTLRARAFSGDNRGAITIQAILFIPVFLIVIFGGLTLWQVLSVKRALHEATYDATRYLIFYPVNSTNPDDWEAVAGVFIEQEMKYSELPGSLHSIEVEGVEDGIGCQNTIRVTVKWMVNINLPLASASGLMLRDYHEGQLCP